MRTLKTSLILLTTFSPALALAQDPALAEEPAEEAEAPAEEAEEAQEADDADTTNVEAEAEAEADVGTEASVEVETAEEEAAAETSTPAPPEPSAAPAAEGNAPLTTASEGGKPTSAPGAPAGNSEAAEARPSPPRTRGGGPETGKWEFGYAGYMRAPMRVGIGESGGPQFFEDGVNEQGRVPEYGLDEDGDLVHVGEADGNPQYHPKQLTLHSPVIPDDQYPSWQFTGHNKRSWAEMFFSVGNGVVSGNLAIQAFQFTDSSWKRNNAQFGIGQGWVELNHDLGYENVKFNAKVGSHWNRYGLAGVYDSGEYDTYIVGRTHVLGGTARVDVDLGGISVGAEGGVGTNESNPDMFNRTRFTTLAHGHGFLELPTVDMGVHLLHAWSAQEVVPNFPARTPAYQEEEWNYVTDEFVGGVDGAMGVWGPEYPNGSQTVAGIDAKFDLGLAGYLFLGYSHMFLSNALTVGDAIESIHSLGAGEYSIGAVDNYLESPFCDSAQADNESCSGGNGNIGSAMLQYELGLANFGVFPGAQDLKIALYGMLNYVNVGDKEVEYLQPLIDAAQGLAQAPELDDIRQDGTIKVKFGMDAEFFATDWFSAGIRADHLRPHSKVPEQAFTILSPRVSFRSAMVTHEEFSIQYSRYFYAQRQCQATGADGTTVVASPAADPFPMGAAPGNTTGALFNQTNPVTGMPLRAYCTQPAPSGNIPYGFGSHTTNQTAGDRGASTLLPDENVIKLQASIWW